MKNELKINGFSSITEDEITDVNGGQIVQMPFPGEIVIKHVVESIWKLITGWF